MRKSIKKSLAVALSALMMFPAQPVAAASEYVLPDAGEQRLERVSVHTASDADEADVTEDSGDVSEAVSSGRDDTVQNDSVQEADGSFSDDLEYDLEEVKEEAKRPELNEAFDEELSEEISEEEELEEATPGDALRGTPQEEVIFNTGNAKVSVVTYEDFMESELGDAYFAEDGSYTIQIPEDNPFFPYEVQFTYDGEVTEEWFMSPDDSVEIGGHEFYVSAYFDGTEVTQMSLNVAGETVVVYPEKKEFTDEGGAAMFSLLPLEEKSLTVDLSGFTPVELTMVSIDSLFAGDTELEDTDKIVWKPRWANNHYNISSQGDLIDLSYQTRYGYSYWEMIVGEADQLAVSNIRYYVHADCTESDEWLNAAAYVQDEQNGRSSVQVQWVDYNDYYDDEGDSRYLEIDLLADELEDQDQVYIGLEVNQEIFEDVLYNDLRAFAGMYSSAEGLKNAEDITDQIFCEDMSAADAGYLIDLDSDEDIWITLAAYDAAGKVIGCLPMELRIYEDADYIGIDLYTASGESASRNGFGIAARNNYRERIFELRAGYPADDTYHLVMEYRMADDEGNAQITGAFVGKYESLAAAKAAGAKDIKDVLFAEGQGYAADFSKGVYFTIFAGENENTEQDMYTCCIKTEEGSILADDNTNVYFYGVKDAEGDYVNSYEISSDEDDYADHTYLTILVDSDADLTALAPEFSIVDGAVLYAEGGSTPEESGKSVHDFSKGPVQYTVSAEDKENAQNYWLQIVQPKEGEGFLYVNSLADEDADTVEKNGVVYSTREMFLDGRYDYKHDILLLNMGTEAIPNLAVELDSDQVELDEYWTLGGVYELMGFSGVGSDDTWNQAKLRLLPKEDVVSGSDISGTLTIKSGDTPLIVFTLTGVAGDPGIVTTDIPAAVKYVHYGTMIQNNNKYDFNTVTYQKTKGTLPNGMVLKANGELYGVPTETGEFSFTVRMTNSYDDFASSAADFTLTVIENTNANVDGATDQDYNLIERVPNITLSNTRDYTMTSAGIFDEWVNLYLDGVMLTEGVDYSAESGSTRLTIRSQTLKSDNTVGTHTLSAEFRTGEAKTLKRAAQNYEVTRKDSSGSSSGSGSSGGSGGGSSSGTSASSAGSLTRDPKKGYVNSQTGIVTGSGDGYARWQQDENGWKLIYADGTAAAGYTVPQENGETAEQVIWEKVNNSWYAFGVNGYLASGWVFDYQLNEWYCISEDSGMQTGWYFEPQDGNTYYLNPVNGALVHGWQEIEGKWYYLNEISAAPTWAYDPEAKNWFYNVSSRTKPWGALYRNEETPDGYRADEDGVCAER